MKWPWSKTELVGVHAPDSGIHVARPDLASILQVASITGAAPVTELAENAAHRRDLMARVSTEATAGHPADMVLAYAAMTASDTSAIQHALWGSAAPESPDERFFTTGHEVLSAWAAEPVTGADMAEAVRERRRLATAVLGEANVAAPSFADCDALRGLPMPGVADFLNAQVAYLSGMELGDFVTYRRTMAADSMGDTGLPGYILLAQAYLAEVAHTVGDTAMVSAIVQDAAVRLALRERAGEPGWDVLLSVLTPPDADRFQRAYPQAKAIAAPQSAG